MPSDLKGMTVFNTEDVDTKKQPMFFGKPLGVQRYDSYKYPIFDKLTTAGNRSEQWYSIDNVKEWVWIW